MKKIFTLATAMIISFNLLAYPPQSKLTINSNLKNSVTILVDGKNYNTNNRTEDDIVINNLATGYHSIKIYQRTNRGRGFGNNNTNQQLVYNGNVYVKPQYHVDITINRFGKAFIDEKLMNSADYDDDYPYNGNGNNNNNNNGGWNSNNNNGGWNNGNNNYRQEMNAVSFAQLKSGINNTSSDAGKQAYAKQAIAQNYVSAAQVKEIIQLFSFETSKLEIAKFSYAYTIDKNNYFLVNDAFNYSSSREELTKFVLQQR